MFLALCFSITSSLMHPGILIVVFGLQIWNISLQTLHCGVWSSKESYSHNTYDTCFCSVSNPLVFISMSIANSRHDKQTECGPQKDNTIESILVGRLLFQKLQQEYQRHFCPGINLSGQKGDINRHNTFPIGWFAMQFVDVPLWVPQRVAIANKTRGVHPMHPVERNKSLPCITC